jgi:hypothetical protein
MNYIINKCILILIIFRYSKFMTQKSYKYKSKEVDDEKTQ